MAIRLRKIDGNTVALCAAATKPEPGDVYLDDGMHHALTTKFGLDFERMGFMADAPNDEILVALTAKAEETPDGKDD